jgi:hypothetical protein
MDIQGVEDHAHGLSFILCCESLLEVASSSG